MLYCGDDGNAYPIRLRPFYLTKRKEQQRKSQPAKRIAARIDHKVFSERQTNTALDHVIFTPDYSMALNQVVKKKRRKEHRKVKEEWDDSVSPHI